MQHFDVSIGALAGPAADNRPWYRTLTRYHWFVLTVAILGWLFDCLDQQLFTLARPAAMESLIPEVSSPADSKVHKSTADKQRFYADLATSIFIAGWACGGLFFGVLGDRIGRAKTMLLTILLYSIFTGLSAVSITIWDFILYRFLTGLGVGGEFAVGVALVAEVMPVSARAPSLTLLQALTTVANVAAALINLGLGIAQEQGMQTSPWRIMFVIGALPALLALVVRSRLQEPEAWQRASRDEAIKKQLGSYRELFGTPLLRKHALLGLVLGCSGIIGLWSVGFFTMDLIRLVQRKPVTLEIYREQLELARAADDSVRVQQLQMLHDHVMQDERPGDDLKGMQEEMAPKINGRLARWPSYVSLMLNFGAALGMIGFGTLASRLGRKPTFVIAFFAAFASTAAVYWFLRELWQIFVMVPIMGFCQFSLFAGYAIYFPELFPTRLRATGTSFCYNVGRFVAALGPLVNSFLRSLFQHPSEEYSFRYAGMAMSCVFLVGLLVLPFLPETRGKPLPE